MSLAQTQPMPVNLGSEFRKLRRLANQGNYNVAIQKDIRAYLWDQHNIVLPKWHGDYKMRKAEIFDHQAYDTAVEDHLHELCNYYYLLFTNKIGIAQFKDGSGFQVVNKRVGQYYSKHRLDPVWNSTKSKKFRGIMSTFLKEEKWHQRYQPTHLVLTVPHKGGIWQGKQIYITELIKAFRALRHERWWKRYIHGGLYCVEVKKNKENGYHIHLHVLCFQNPVIYDSRNREIQDPINHVRAKINKAWRTIVGNTTDHNGAFYESLYVPERDVNGKLVIEEVASERSDWQFKTGVKKYYIKPGDSEEMWIKGVMECLKYHFKPGVLEKTDRSFDIPLIIEMLNNTKGERFMSKFGKLHNHRGLSLSGKKADDDIDSDCLGDAMAAQENLVNPFTQSIASSEEYNLFFTGLENIVPYQDPITGLAQVRLKARSPVLFFEQGTTIKEAFTQYASGKFTKGVKGLSVEDIPLEGIQSGWKKHVNSEWSTVEQVQKVTDEECPF